MDNPLIFQQLVTNARLMLTIGGQPRAVLEHAILDPGFVVHTYM